MNESTYSLDTMLVLGISKFRESLVVDEDLESGIVNLKFNAIEPRLAASVLSSLIQELDLHQKNFNNSQMKKKRIFIQERIKDVKIDLTKVEENLKDFRLKNRNYTDSPSLLLEFERLKMDAEVQKELYITLKQEFELAQIKEVEESDILHILDEPNIPLNPSKPKKKFFMIISTLIGILASSIFIIVKK